MVDKQFFFHKDMIQNAVLPIISALVLLPIIPSAGTITVSNLGWLPSPSTYSTGADTLLLLILLSRVTYVIEYVNRSLITRRQLSPVMRHTGHDTCHLSK